MSHFSNSLPLPPCLQLMSIFYALLTKDNQCTRAAHILINKSTGHMYFLCFFLLQYRKCHFSHHSLSLPRYFLALSCILADADPKIFSLYSHHHSPTHLDVTFMHTNTHHSSLTTLSIQYSLSYCLYLLFSTIPNYTYIISYVHMPCSHLTSRPFFNPFTSGFYPTRLKQPLSTQSESSICPNSRLICLFLKFDTYMNHLGIFFNADSDSVDLKWYPRFHRAKKVSGDLNVAHLQTIPQATSVFRSCIFIFLVAFFSFSFSSKSPFYALYVGSFLSFRSQLKIDFLKKPLLDYSS